MKKHLTIKYAVDNQLCTGCGVCADICPKNAISFQIMKGINVPCIDTDLCTNIRGCSKCYRLCPGIEIKINELSNNLFLRNNSKFDSYIGHYQNCYSGYSNDYEIRYHSASGGLLSQFLIYLLEKKIIDGAVVTRFNPDSPSIPEVIIATTIVEILSGKSSKYCPVSLNGIATHLKKCQGKFIVVGLPCHIHGFRKLENLDKVLKDKILGYFSIYCSSTRTFDATKYIFLRYGIDAKKLKYFAYRDDGCLGYLKAKTEISEVKVPYRVYYHSLRSFFKPKRCIRCVDHYGDLADVCFGDIQTGEYKNDKIGVNSIIVRNKHFDDLLKKAQSEGILELTKIDSEIVNDSQKTMLKHKRNIAGLTLKLDTLRGRKVPEYDIDLPLKYTIRGFFSYMSTSIQIEIGKRKNLWFVIKFLDRLKFFI